MIRRFAFILIIGTLFLSGCSYKFYDFLFYDQELHGIQISGRVAGIDIIDLRAKSLISEIKIPNSQFLGYDVIAHPALTNSHKELIDMKVRSYFTNSGEKLKVVCYIVNTVKKAKASMFKSSEFALVEMSIAIYDEHDKLLDFVTSTFSHEHKPTGSVQYEIEYLFEKALRSVIYQCFDEFKNIKKTVTLGRAYRYSVVKKEELQSE
ncbi:MAG: hypothetical protein JZU47_14060 [Prolixibacteraceae bacterium]|nr:hypothetical protein [Prolixibacteraceae bacterium]